MLGFFGCLGNPPGGRKEKRGEFIDIKPMSNRERLIWRWFGIVVFTLLFVLSVTAIVIYFLNLISP